MVTFIGDVHGWSDRLEKVVLQAEGPLVFMGDLIDRGPDAPAVLRRVYELCQQGRATCLMGNHEYAMLRAIGVPAQGLTADPAYFLAWANHFGGAAVLEAYRTDCPDGLRERLGSLATWLAELPWVLEGDVGPRHWVAVHAGLEGVTPLQVQLEALRSGWRAPDPTPLPLFAKDRQFTVPPDLPAHWTIVSGHTPMLTPFISQQRVLCDTSGGARHRRLSGVIWPEGRTVTS